MKHTKGNWEVLRQGKEIQGSDEQCEVCGEYDGGQHEVSVIIEGLPVTVCYLDVAAHHSESNPVGPDTEYHLTETESLANARLIAAAPELLEALDIARNFLNGCREYLSEGDGTCAIPDYLDRKIDQAIAKTEGK